MKTFIATIKWLGEDEEFTVQFGVFPDWFDIDEGNEEDLPNDKDIFYWLDKEEAEQFGVGFSTDEWVVTEVDA